ncbi:thermonuclease family protein [Chthonobacter rhizosphaerae]|uniref:thermonuclease family protein n=1 Tax=Chthonobacter rhizosphaerae TaxID=2735553 RepID=UPI0015EF1A6B|nr:thermonuclease family protein [Chthonobacter rhizosphaerae]
MTSEFLVPLACAAFLACLTPSGATEAVRVVDGDTIRIGRATVRLHGIDAPEAGQSCAAANGGRWSCGKAAVRTLESLVKGRSVTCDDRGSDAYGRTLAVCVAGGKEINRLMVDSGAAWAFRRYSDDYAAAEDRARAARRGIWQAPTETAWDYRAHRWDTAAGAAPANCPIKGNVSDKGRIYHAPWSPWYEKTKVSVDKGERWFCSEDEAIAAGWRAPDWGG